MDNKLFNDLRSKLILKADQDAADRAGLKETGRLFVAAVNQKIGVVPEPASSSQERFDEGKFHFCVLIRFNSGNSTLMNASIRFSAEVTEQGVLFTCIETGSFRSVLSANVLNPAAYADAVDLIDDPLKRHVDNRIAEPFGPD